MLAGRSRNYTQKYPPDPFGKEADDEARVWLVYLDEAESYDGDMIRGFKDTIDALLVLAGLFSVIVAVFLAQTSLNLKPNHAQLAVILLAEQVALLRLANGSPANTTTPRVDQNTLTFTKTDVLVNGLFFSSLALAMFTALLGVLVKQWLQAYNSQTSGSAKERALTRQFRFRGLQKWKVSQIVGFLPLLLHTSFAAFLSGLGVFVHDLHPSLTWVIVALSGLIFSSIFSPSSFLLSG
ncbi:hypothetical protein DL96DRAFT_1467072 [Flagelloscypha sp. PMI_526]|nr:hypothetical protein DL96DRAFT_1467072 [Flagelloscypha sp. PMI_526]